MSSNLFTNWPIRSEDKPRLERFLTTLAKRLDKKLSYVELARIIFDHSDAVIDVITTAETVTNNPKLEGSVPA